MTPVAGHAVQQDEPAVNLTTVRSDDGANAARALPEEEYRLWLETLPPESLRRMREESEYWNSLYSPLVGGVQEWIYDLYLKGNRVPGGTANYSEVVGMIISLDFQ